MPHRKAIDEGSSHPLCLCCGKNINQLRLRQLVHTIVLFAVATDPTAQWNLED